jgi:hypothetical protein
MRIWGYVLLGLGILFLIFFALAQLGGGHVGVTPFIVSLIMIVSGARMVSGGRGLVQAEPTAPSRLPSTGVPGTSAPAAQSSDAGQWTVEMPMSPQVAAVITAQSTRRWKPQKYWCGGFVVFFVGLGAVFTISAKSNDDRVLVASLASIGIVTVSLVAGFSWMTTRRPVLKDLNERNYLRTTGPISVVFIYSGAMLRLADRAFVMNGRDGIAPLSKLGQGRVDYSPHGHVILAAWDSMGRRVYCAPGYDVDYGS